MGFSPPRGLEQREFSPIIGMILGDLWRSLADILAFKSTPHTPLQIVEYRIGPGAVHLDVLRAAC
jgi:hypothetical protein